MIQGGDPTGTGRGGASIYGKTFDDEIDDDLKHTGAGILRWVCWSSCLKGFKFCTRPGKSFTASRSRNFRELLLLWIFRAFFVVFWFSERRKGHSRACYVTDWNPYIIMARHDRTKSNFGIRSTSLTLSLTHSLTSFTFFPNSLTDRLSRRRVGIHSR